ncbi:hypothetical protein VCR15J2_390037 [Vibrio coralliirubri]|uniref:hypothetical protein n=1 Tax=Vibrio coralliirubri TaxID=1516159 RepID=UPI000632C96F|nr:hypothetical protein [Vibrio coralliirubri]CDT53025.1 hypothetical protein VCR15J2_390037 [Vibrio coralliirubri]
MTEHEFKKLEKMALSVSSYASQRAAQSEIREMEFFANTLKEPCDSYLNEKLSNVVNDAKEACKQGVEADFKMSCLMTSLSKLQGAMGSAKTRAEMFG